MRRGSRRAGRETCSGADPRPDRMGHTLRQNPRRPIRTEPRGRAYRTPHPPPRRPHGRRDRTGAGRVGSPAPRHHGAGTPFRHRPPDAAPPGRIRHAPYARAGLLRRLCAQPRHQRDRDHARQVHRRRHGRLRQYLLHDLQPGRRHGRRHRHVPPRQGHHREHGVHPVPPHDALQPRRETQFPHHGGHARFRCHPSPAFRRGVHGQIPPDEIAGAARRGGPRHLPRNDQAGLGLRLPRRHAQRPRSHPQSLPQHLRKMPFDRHRHHPRLDSRDACGALLLRRGESRHQRRDLDQAPLRAGRNLLHGAARSQPPRFQLADRSGGLCRPGRTPRCVAAPQGRHPGGHPRLGLRRHAAHRGDADDHPVEARDADHPVQLRGHRPLEPLAQTRHAPPRDTLAGDRGAL